MGSRKRADSGIEADQLDLPKVPEMDPRDQKLIESLPAPSPRSAERQRQQAPLPEQQKSKRRDNG